MEIRGLPLGIAIRAIRADDLIPLERFYAGLSHDSTDARFHGATHGIADDTARSFCGPDHVHREGLVAVARVANIVRFTKTYDSNETFLSLVGSFFQGEVKCVQLE